MDLFSALGFNWSRLKTPDAISTHSIERVTFRFHQMLSIFVWDASVLEGNPFTYPEVKTLLDGVSVGGRKISDQEQVLNLAESSKHLLALVKANKFKLDKATFTDLHSLVARNEALEWGHFRGEGTETTYTPDVALGEHGRYTPLPTLKEAPDLNRAFLHSLVARNEALEWGHFRGEGTETTYTPDVALGEHGRYTPSPTLKEAPDLNRAFLHGVQELNNQVDHPFEKALAFFLFGALQQFFFDGNKRTSRFMMNGILMSAGIDAISVPAAKVQEFNEKMVRFYLSKDATEMMEFMVGCYESK